MASSSSSSPVKYPCPSTLNVANFVTVKLCKDNYLIWKEQMLCLIESQDLLGFIDGTTAIPAETITDPNGDSSINGTSGVVNQDYLYWRRSDRLLKGWILGSLSEDVLADSVVGLNTARDVWVKLGNTLAPADDESGVSIKLDNYYKDPNAGDIENLVENSHVTRQMGDRVRLLGGKDFSSVCQRLHVLLWEFMELLVPRIKQIRKNKLVHHQALQLVKHLCKEIKSLNELYACTRGTEIPILLAASLGIHEVIEEIVDTFPNEVWAGNDDRHHLLQVAVTNRCEKVFNLIYQMSGHKYYITMSTDTSENNILHLAGRLAPPHKLNLVSGAALQMQRELQWFKEVEKFVNPAYKEDENSSKETPAMVFTKEHKNLVIEGESG